jgi:hypothetical protein
MAIAVALVWPATASTKLSAAESETPSVGPASRVQPRQADAIRTLGNASPVELAIDWQPILQAAADWRANLSRVQWTFDVEQRLAQIDPGPSEPVAVGDAERDPCYVSEPLATLRANIEAPPGMLPEDIAAHCRAAAPAREDARMVGGWSCFNKRWSATCMRHRPLYFEETNAERYGYVSCGPCLQPLVSAGHFLATIPTLPYQMCVNPPCECTYTLGHYRPGSCVPNRPNRWPCSTKAGVFEAVVIVGLIALIP